MKARPALSFDELERFIASMPQSLGDGWTNYNVGEGRVPPSLIANMLGVDVNSIHRWKAWGVPYYSADRAATRLGLHPLEIWPDFYIWEDYACHA